jgi:hypothetical protein
MRAGKSRGDGKLILEVPSVVLFYPYQQCPSSQLINANNATSLSELKCRENSQ